MKKITILCAAVMSLYNVTFAQSPNDNNPDHVNYYVAPAPIKTDDLVITFVDIVAKTEYCKFKIKITNNTADYIIFKPTECVFTIDGKTYNPTKGVVFIKPYDDASKVLEVKGGNAFHRDSFQLKLAGLYKLPANGNVQNAPDFVLPNTVNSFDAGVFKCSVVDVKKESDETVVKFKVIYNGNDYGIIEPSRPVVRIPNKANPQETQEFVTSKTKVKPIMLQRGEEDKFSIEFSRDNIPGKFNDMQFANMTVLWKNTFTDSKATALPEMNVPFVVDQGLTAGKNK